MRRQTIGARLAELRAPAGFDYLRIVLSIAVLCFHSIRVSYGPSAEDALIWEAAAAAPVRLILPMFFALSGFLVAGSVFRSGSISGFVLLRALRLVPALAVEVALTGIVLGAAVTTLPAHEYFSSRQFWTYGLNVVGYIHYVLPGVFVSNPFNGAANFSLWTVPFELECYIALIFLMVTGIVRFRWAVLGLTVVACAAAALHMQAHHSEPTLMRVVDARILVLCFLAGLSTYLFREHLPLSNGLFCVCVIAALILLQRPAWSWLTPMPIAYLTVWLGMTNPRKPALLSSGDYSYGIYLYAFPIQQTIASFAPMRHWWISILVGLPISVLFAAFSWHCVEKHVLAHKRAVAGKDAPLPRFEAALLGHARRGWRAVSRNHVDTPSQV